MSKTDYCLSCNGYEAEVGKMDADGLCRCCNYRTALELIRDRDWVENALDPQWAARIAGDALSKRSELSESDVPGFLEVVEEAARVLSQRRRR